MLALYSLAEYYVEKRKIPELLTTGNEMVSLSKKLNFPRGEGLSHLVLGWHYNWSFKPDETYEHLGLAMDLLKNSSDEINYAKALLQQIDLSNSMTNSEEALKYCKMAEPLILKLNIKKNLYRLYAGYSTSYSYTQDDFKALEYDLKAEKVALQIGDQKIIAGVYQNIASDFIAQQEDSIAFIYLQKAIAINNSLPDRFWQLASNKYLIADINTRKGKFREALGFIQETFDYFDKHDTANVVPQRCQFLVQFGLINEKIGDSAQEKNNTEYARVYWKKALDYFLDGHNKYIAFYKGLVSPYLAKCVGSAFYKMGDIVKSRSYLNVALEQSKKINNKGFLADIYLLLSRCDSVAGDYKGAYVNMQNYHLYNDSISSVEKSKMVNFYKSQAEAEKKEKELQVLSSENELKTSLANQQKQKRKFAYALSGLIILGTGYGVFRYRKFNKQKSEQRRLKERLAISQDLHDHVGSTLSSISVYSKVAQVEGEKGNADKMNELLDKVRDTSSKMITEMNDIVWAINPQNDTMEKIIQRMESFARPLLAARNMQFHFNYDEVIKSLNLEMEQRKNFYLIFKEAVNNAIKYSGGSLLEANIIHQQGTLELLVKDNGVGFKVETEMNNAASLSGNGLKNMMTRAKEMNANLQIESISGSGTTLRLVLPMI